MVIYVLLSGVFVGNALSNLPFTGSFLCFEGLILRGEYLSRGCFGLD